LRAHDPVPIQKSEISGWGHQPSATSHQLHRLIIISFSLNAEGRPLTARIRKLPFPDEQDPNNLLLRELRSVFHACQKIETFFWSHFREMPHHFPCR
jgi:hypothetical protein